MRWVLLWAVLVIAAVVFLTLLLLRLWRQVKAVAAELRRASERVDEASSRITDGTRY